MQMISLRNTFASAALVCLFTIVASAANFTVNTADFTADANTADGVCADGNGNCSLRAAINQANALAGADSITFDPILFSMPRTIPASASYPAINDSLTINGTSSANVIIDGAGNARLFTINPGVTASISNLTVTRGYIGESSGGCIYVGGTLTLSNSVVSFCEALLGDGGGIYAASGSTVTINNAVLNDNSTTDNGAGIAVVGATVTINDSTIRNNSAEANGGGIAVDGGTVNINRSTIGAGNSTQINGGGIFNSGGNVNLTNSTISGNTAITYGGGYYGVPLSGSASLLSQSSTIAFNSAGSAGGGVAVDFLSAAISKLQLGSPSIAFISNTIISNNTAPVGPDVSDNPDGVPFMGEINSLGYNIVQNTSGANINPNTGDQLGVNPLLNPLGNNGGPTQTHSLQNASPAIDKGNSPLPVDQRGMMRPVDQPAYPPATGGNNSDIGSFEAMIITAASVSVSGRVVSENGIGLSRVRLTLMEFDGTVHSALTNQFGFYYFENIQPGQSVALTASRKGYNSQSYLLTVNEDVRDVDMVMYPF